MLNKYANRHIYNVKAYYMINFTKGGVFLKPDYCTRGRGLEKPGFSK